MRHLFSCCERRPAWLVVATAGLEWTECLDTVFLVGHLRRWAGPRPGRQGEVCFVLQLGMDAWGRRRIVRSVTPWRVRYSFVRFLRRGLAGSGTRTGLDGVPVWTWQPGMVMGADDVSATRRTRRVVGGCWTFVVALQQQTGTAG